MERRAVLLVSLVLVLGCNDARPEPRAETPPATAAAATTQFNFATTGTVRGRVSWVGELPSVPPFEILPHPLSGDGFRVKQVRANPNAPQVDPRGRGVGQAVVFLRGVERRQARPWDLPAVRVEHRERQLLVLQGDEKVRVGFVQRGAAITLVSKEPLYHSLCVRGATFFSLAFPDPDQPLDRRLNENGLVELSSGAGYFFMRAYLFVDEHPYYARTDADGQFVLPQVPPGRYEVVCWLPSWLPASHERDPESGRISRLAFKPPREQCQIVTIGDKESRTVDFEIATKDFDR